MLAQDLCSSGFRWAYCWTVGVSTVRAVFSLDLARTVLSRKSTFGSFAHYHISEMFFVAYMFEVPKTLGISNGSITVMKGWQALGSGDLKLVQVGPSCRSQRRVVLSTFPLMHRSQEHSLGMSLIGRALPEENQRPACLRFGYAQSSRIPGRCGSV